MSCYIAFSHNHNRDFQNHNLNNYLLNRNQSLLIKIFLDAAEKEDFPGKSFLAAYMNVT